MSIKWAIPQGRQRFAIATIGAAIVGISELPGCAATQHFDQIFVFGDSLSDVGNAYKSTPGNFPPSPPYFQGRYSNGPVWVEYLALKLKLTANTNTNFAFAGATTNGATGTPQGLLSQVKSFTATHATADPNALYIIWAGTNDYLRGATNSSTPVNNLLMAVKSLSSVGAKNIVLVNLPDLGKLPSTRIEQRSASLTDLTNKHNSRLAASLVGLRHQISSDVSITYLDVNSLFKQVIKTPEKFGFTDVTNPCLTKDSVCAHPNKYLFWDGIHPTTAAHKLFVEVTFPALRPAPPNASTNASISIPIALTLGLFGFGVGAGLVLRKKAVKNRS